MGLVIDLDRLERIAARANAPREAPASGPRNGPYNRGATITEAILAETRARYPDCQCEQQGRLRPGMSLLDALRAGSCTELGHRWMGNPDGSRSWVHVGGPGGVCPRMDMVRRRYGH